MKKKWMSALLLGCAICLAACGAEQAQDASTIQEQGEVQEGEDTLEPEAEQAAAEEAADEAEQAADEEGAPEDGQGAPDGGAGGPRDGQGGPGGGHGPGGPGGGGHGGGVDKSSDAELQTMISEVVPKFELLSFEDEESGTSLQYWLYVPENYDEGTEYPLLQFIPDSSAVGRDDEYFLTQGWGGLIWATEEEQAKHPSFVVVPIFTETVVDDDFNHSGQIDVAVRLIESLSENYSIDKNRIYTTGQSMGGMTSFYLNIAYPDLFAASFFVGSQWDVSKLDILEDKEFFYIVAAGDPKASAGQAELMELFDKDGSAYSHREWSAQDDSDTQASEVENMLREGHIANFVTFTEGSTLAEGQSAMPGAGEHMTSFDYAYKLGTVRDWLFEQSK